MPLDFGFSVFAFTTGALTFFNPCGIAMLPAYISYYLSQNENKSSTFKRVLKGLYLGTTVSFGFLLIFISIGIALSLLGNEFLGIVPWAAVMVGVILIIVGILILFNFNFGLQKLDLLGNKLKANKFRGNGSFFLYGVGYAIASLGCTLPIFLVITAGAFQGGVGNGIFQFIIYSLGMSSVMIGVSIAVAISKSTVDTYLNKMMPYVKKISALVIIGAGLYILYFQLFLGNLI